MRGRATCTSGSMNRSETSIHLRRPNAAMYGDGRRCWMASLRCVMNRS